jgi:cytochrome c553
MHPRILSAVSGTLLVGSILMSGGARAQAEPKKDADPATLFARLGCALCHAPGARYHDRIVTAAGKSEQELAKWIRNPEQFVSGTTMPTYASLIDEPTALALARWIKSGGPSAPRK